MANHFRSTLEKLTYEELNALVSPLVAVALGGTADDSDSGAVVDFIERYEAALAVNERQLVPMAPNGATYETEQADELDEVAGFQFRPNFDQRPDRQQWLRMSGSLTGGRLGIMPTEGQTISTYIGFRASK